MDDLCTLVGDSRRPRMTEATVPSSPTATTTGIGQARTLLGHSREELRFVDTKASLLFTIIGVVVGVTASAAVALSWNPIRLGLPIAVLSWVAIVAALVSVLMIGAAIYPRTELRVVEPISRVAYFADVARYDDVTTLRAALDRSAVEEYELLIEELLAVSRIAVIKYRLISRSLWALLLSGGTACAAIGVSAWL